MGVVQDGAFGRMLRHFREEAGLTQEELAERAGLSPRSVSDIERGISRTPYQHTVERLAAALGLRGEDRARLEGAVHRRRGPARSEEPSPSPDLTPLFGRERDLAEAVYMLRWQGVRLLTLTGPGGVGKTRLAVSIAGTVKADYRDGVHLISLVAVRDPGRVPAFLLRELGGSPDDTESAEAALIGRLKTDRTLLVIDNFEQVAAAGSMLRDLLLACPGVQIIVTSRWPLRVRGEHELPVGPLALPDPAALPPRDRLEQYPAIALFVHHARAVRPEFRLTADTAPAIASICAKLDGLPLAIELAAPWIRTLSPQALLMRLEGRLQMLAGGPRDLPTRQQTMEAAIDWSYRLLPPDQQAAFRRLSALPGGWDLETATAVAGEDGDEEAMLQTLGELVEKSLIRPVEHGDMPRFCMLETTREFAAQQLARSGETELVARLRRDWYLAFSDRAGAALDGPEQQTWLERIEEEHVNLRATLAWCLPAPEERAAGLRIAFNIARFWQVRGYLREGITWFDRLLAAKGPIPRALEAQARNVAGNTANLLGDYPRAEELYQRSLVLFEQEGATDRAATVLNNLAVMHEWAGRTAEAIPLYEHALALYEEREEDWGIAQVQLNLGPLIARNGARDEGVEMLEAALAWYRQQGDNRLAAGCLHNLGWIMLESGNTAQALALSCEALEVFAAIEDKVGIAGSLETLASACSPDQAAPAIHLLAAATRLRADIGLPLPPSELAAVDEATARFRGMVGDEVFAAAWREGEALSQEAAVELALALRPEGRHQSDPATRIRPSSLGR